MAFLRLEILGLCPRLVGEIAPLALDTYPNMSRPTPRLRCIPGRAIVNVSRAEAAITLATP